MFKTFQNIKVLRLEVPEGVQQDQKNTPISNSTLRMTMPLRGW